MCKWSKWGDTRIDPCMRRFIKNLEWTLRGDYKVVACCCGHRKYPMTVVISLKKGGVACFELISGSMILRMARFYKRDKHGYYYIPETLEK
jgi:hypothetical protein